MRPARKGPENDTARCPSRRRRGRFNEAGPQGAGKPRLPAAAERGRRASMRPARKGPENEGGREGRERRHAASMRPARKGPENASCP